MDNHNVNQNEVVEKYLRTPLNGFRIIDLKQVIHYINNKASERISPSGLKAAIIERIIQVIVGYVARGRLERLQIAVEALNSPRRRYQWLQREGRLEFQRLRQRYSTQTVQHQQMQPVQNNNQPTFVSLIYKQGPFFETVHEISRPVLCKVAVHGRAQRNFIFTLNSAQQALISSGNHEIRIFCSRYQATNQPQVIEFPEICEIKINNTPVLSGQNLRGIKGTPGTMHPPNITQFLNVSGTNKIEMIYATANGSQFAACIRLVRRYSVDSLVEKLINQHTVTKDEILKQFQRKQEEADVVVEFETLSMKCPLGFTRIQTPIRSKMCTHAQCFEAFTFLKMNEQTPTWSCPACYKRIGSYNDLFVDGYFQDILRDVGQRVDTVRIGPSGELQHVKVESDVSDAASSTSDSSSHPTNNRLSSATADTTITILDDDDDDGIVNDNLAELKGVKRQASDEISTECERRARRPIPSNFIDLTLSDDEDNENRTTTNNNNNSSNNNNSNINSNNNSNSNIQQLPDNPIPPPMASIHVVQQSQLSQPTVLPPPSITSQGQPTFVVLTPQGPQNQPLPTPVSNPNNNAIS